MTTKTTPHFLSMTTAEQAAHLLSIPKPDPDRLQREYEAAMLEKAKASLTAARLARFGKCLKTMHKHVDTTYPIPCEMYEGARIAAIALSRQVTRHI